MPLRVKAAKASDKSCLETLQKEEQSKQDDEIFEVECSIKTLTYFSVSVYLHSLILQGHDHRLEVSHTQLTVGHWRMSRSRPGISK